MSARRLAATLATLATCALTGGPAVAQQELLAVGDSITAGTGDAVPEGQDAGYPARLRQLVPGLSVLNAGIPGERTFELLSRLDEVLAEGGDALLLMEGTNDLTRRFPIESVVFNLGEIADRAEDAGFEVVHATVIPRLPGAKIDGGNLLNRQLNQRIRDLAGRKNRRLVDSFEVFSRLSNLFDSYYWDNPNDPVGHPNPAGYDVMAQTFADVLQDFDRVGPVAGILDPVLGETDVPPDATIRVDLWDFGAGIDLAGSFLLIAGEVTPTIPFGNSRGASFVYQPAEPLAGVVTVSVRTRDFASPVNQVERDVSRFAVVGSSFRAGDFDASGVVDDIDLIQISLSFGGRSGDSRYSATADLNADGIVDGIDLAILAANYGVR
ncbi:MAG TPA: GDSL-type esterase/lipase family protein [Thermoanaerobaculia bacterium]|nr:GDSL-type esterase/lipase family protein [Thermoanaerobaculia bacterium]